MEKEHTSITLILGAVGLVIGILANVAYFQEGGRVSFISLALYPCLGAGIGAIIDGNRDKKDR